MLLNSKLALQESSGRERAAPSRFLFLVVMGWLLVCIIRIPFLVCLALWSRSQKGVRVQSRRGAGEKRVEHWCVPDGKACRMQGRCEDYRRARSA